MDPAADRGESRRSRVSGAFNDDLREDECNVCLRIVTSGGLGRPLAGLGPALVRRWNSWDVVASLGVVGTV